MRLDLGPELETFRDEIQSWLEDNRIEGLDRIDERSLYRGVVSHSPAVRDAYDEWTRRLAAVRLICPQWPKEVGGRGLTGVHIAILNEEFSQAGVPRVNRGMGESLVGPSIIVHGTEEQKARFLPRIISGEDRYCQGFSEPDHGSDLAGIETEARSNAVTEANKRGPRVGGSSRRSRRLFGHWLRFGLRRRRFRLAATAQQHHRSDETESEHLNAIIKA